MKKVYIITAGEYSDYHIVAACSTKAKAVKTCTYVNLPETDIDEWELDQIDLTKPGWANYSVRMTQEGDSEVKICTDPEEFIPLPKTWHSIWENHAGRWRLSVKGYFADEQHAVKVANEIRVRVLAEKGFDTPAPAPM